MRSRSDLPHPSWQEDVVETDPVRMMEAMIGIPGVRVAEIY
jgi:hypothetical protein